MTDSIGFKPVRQEKIGQRVPVFYHDNLSELGPLIEQLFGYATVITLPNVWTELVVEQDEFGPIRVQIGKKLNVTLRCNDYEEMSIRYNVKTLEQTRDEAALLRAVSTKS